MVYIYSNERTARRLFQQRNGTEPLIGWCVYQIVGVHYTP